MSLYRQPKGYVCIYEKKPLKTTRFQGFRNEASSRTRTDDLRIRYAPVCYRQTCSTQLSHTSILNFARLSSPSVMSLYRQPKGYVCIYEKKSLKTTIFQGFRNEASSRTRTDDHELSIKRRFIRFKKQGIHPDSTPLSPILRRVPVYR